MINIDYVKSITIGKIDYTVQVCSAQQQWDILNLFFKYGLSQALYRISEGDNSFVASAIFGSFSEKSSDSERELVTRYLLGGCVKKGTETAITIDDFQNQMFNYILLHIEALKFNFSDFLPFLQSPVLEETEKTPESEEMSQL